MNFLINTKKNKLGQNFMMSNPQPKNLMLCKVIILLTLALIDYYKYMFFYLKLIFVMLRCNVITSNIEIPGEFLKKIIHHINWNCFVWGFFMRPLPYHDNENTWSTDILYKKKGNTFLKIDTSWRFWYTQTSSNQYI